MKTGNPGRYYYSRALVNTRMLFVFGFSDHFRITYILINSHKNCQHYVQRYPCSGYFDCERRYETQQVSELSYYKNFVDENKSVSSCTTIYRNQPNQMIISYSCH